MLNDENAPEVVQDENNTPQETPEEKSTTEEETIDWKKRAHELQIILDRNKGYIDKVKGRSTKKEESKTDTSGKLDYGMKAFLAATHGIKESSEFEFVEKNLRESGKQLEELLENKYFKAELEDFRAKKKSEEATPSTSGRNGNSAYDSVEYWKTKDIKDVPPEKRIEVVNARLQEEKSKGIFYNS
jgi:hypothetical protein